MQIPTAADDHSRHAYLTSYLVLVVMLLFSVGGWYLAEQHFQAHQSAHFDADVYRTEARVQQRMQHYGDILKAAASLFDASQHVTPAEFQNFVHSLEVTERYPGIQALGFIRHLELQHTDNFMHNTNYVHRTQPCGYPDFSITPNGRRPEYMIVAFIEPIARNQNLVGRDLLLEPACKAAMENARDTGQISASGLIDLTRNDQVLRAFTVVMPIYKNASIRSAGLQERRDHLQGFVFGSFIGVELFRGIFGDRVHSDIDFEVFDGEDTSADNLIYDDDNVLHASDPNYVTSHSRISNMHVFGRDWHLYFSASAEFHQHFERHVPALILAGGILTSLLLFGLTRIQIHNSLMKLQYADELKYQAAHDALTQLPNRSVLYDRLNQLLSMPQLNFALLMLDLDGFKEINDTLGHYSGDMLLRQLGPRLLKHIGDQDLLVRLGGDEFAVIFYPITDTESVFARARSLMEHLREPFQLEDIQVQVDGSAGLVVVPGHGNSSSELLRLADVAMYTAKRQHVDVVLYREELDKHNPRHLQLVSELSRAIENNELELYYQPKVRLRDNRVIGVEALLRWNHPRYGFIGPGDFIPQAENSSVIKPLTLWVITEALRQCKSWQAQGMALSIAVNVSARNLMDRELPDEIAKIIEHSCMHAHCLELEVTESAIIADTQRAVKTLSALHRAGMKISIDDFGSGYTSIGHLKNLPISTLKIDQTFVSNMENIDDDAIIVHSVTRLAHNLGLCVVAEGVEDAETLLTLKIIDADFAQGYHLCRPKPADEFTEWVQQYNHALNIALITE